MRPQSSRPHFAALFALAGTLGCAPMLAQTELPPLQTSSSSRRTLERPPVYDLPASTTAATRSPGSSSSRSATGSIPDTSIFNGSKYPPEERPEQGLIAQFEMPGQPQPSNLDVPGPGDQKGGGGQGPGGDDSMNSGGMPGGMQTAGGAGGIPGLQIPGMGGGGGGGEQQSMAAIPELSMGDRGQQGGQEGEEGDQSGGGGQGQEGGEPGDQQGGPAGAASDQEAPKLAGRQGRQLEKPDAVQIGDEGAKLAEADVPVVDSSRAMDGNAKGEDRMAVQSAAGQQSGERGSGSERGVDIPSNL